MDYITVYGTPVFASIGQIMQKLQIETDKIGRIKKSSNSLMIVCPFHDDSNPSLGININNLKKEDGSIIPAGTVNCLGCDYSSDLVTFISNLFDKNDTGMYGYKWLTQNFTVGEFVDRRIDFNINRGNETVINFKFGNYENYHSYLEQRGISKELALIYNIGYDVRTNTIVFPIYDFDNNIIGEHKRYIHTKGFYNNGVIDYLYGLQNVDYTKNSICLTEAPLDCLSCVKNNYNAIGFLGTPSAKQINLLKKLPFKIFVCAFDNDKAGDKASELIKNNFKNKIIKRVEFIGGDDPNEIIDNFKFNIVNLY